MFSIGNLQFSSPYILAPMAGVSDLPFRLINRLFGCSLAFTEMISARGLVYDNWRTVRMLASVPEDSPLGVQLLGGVEETLSSAVDILEEYTFALIDFNAACPVIKVVRRGEGAALLKEPDRFERLLRSIVRRSGKPVTVKIRSGWDEHSVNAVEIARRAQDAGASALFIHGRTRSQAYGGTVDYTVIKDVKEAVTIPVIASGDIFSAAYAKAMFDRTGCDGVAVARGSLGNPWIFPEIAHFIETGEFLERAPLGERIPVMKRHLDLLVQTFGDEAAVISFRKFFIWYTKGLRNARELRPRVMQFKTREDIDGLLDTLEERERSLSMAERLSQQQRPQ